MINIVGGVPLLNAPLVHCTGGLEGDGSRADNILSSVGPLMGMVNRDGIDVLGAWETGGALVLLLEGVGGGLMTN